MNFEYVIFKAFAFSPFYRGSPGETCSCEFSFAINLHRAADVDAVTEPLDGARVALARDTVQFTDRQREDFQCTGQVTVRSFFPFQNPGSRPFRDVAALPCFFGIRVKASSALRTA